MSVKRTSSAQYVGSVKRFNFSRNSIRTPPLDCGEYVRYSDYSKLKRARDELRSNWLASDRAARDAEARLQALRDAVASQVAATRYWAEGGDLEATLVELDRLSALLRDEGGSAIQTGGKK